MSDKPQSTELGYNDKDHPVDAALKVDEWNQQMPFQKSEADDSDEQTKPSDMQTAINESGTPTEALLTIATPEETKTAASLTPVLEVSPREQIEPSYGRVLDIKLTNELDPNEVIDLLSSGPRRSSILSGDILLHLKNGTRVHNGLSESDQAESLKMSKAVFETVLEEIKIAMEDENHEIHKFLNLIGIDKTDLTDKDKIKKLYALARVAYDNTMVTAVRVARAKVTSDIDLQQEGQEIFTAISNPENGYRVNNSESWEFLLNEIPGYRAVDEGTTEEWDNLKKEREAFAKYFSRAGFKVAVSYSENKPDIQDTAGDALLTKYKTRLGLDNSLDTDEVVSEVEEDLAALDEGEKLDRIKAAILLGIDNRLLTNEIPLADLENALRVLKQLAPQNTMPIGSLERAIQRQQEAQPG